MKGSELPLWGPSDYHEQTMTMGLVLSGGGARGAYEAGLLAGMFDVLGLGPRDTAPFQLFAGTSVGAINAAYLAAHADRGDMAIAGLIDIWQGLSLRRHLKVDTLRFLGLRDKLPFARRDGTMGRSLLDPKPIYNIVEDGIPWDRLHRNVKAGRVRGLLVTALHIATGVTHIFTELSPDTEFSPSLDPLREPIPGLISSHHVLASCAPAVGLSVVPDRRVVLLRWGLAVQHPAGACHSRGSKTAWWWCL